MFSTKGRGRSIFLTSPVTDRMKTVLLEARARWNLWASLHIF